MPMPASPSVLATYLAAAAKQALKGDELSARSRWAIAHAREQIKENRDVIAEEEIFLTSNSTVGVRKLKAEEEPDLAEMVLSVNRDSSTQPTVEARTKQAAAELDRVLEDLRTLSSEESHPGAKDAAQHLLDIFGPRSSSLAA